MRFDSVGCFYDGKAFVLSRWSGSLRMADNATDFTMPRNAKRPRKVGAALELCHHPFLIPQGRASAIKGNIAKVAPQGLKAARRLVNLSRQQFLLASLYACWSYPLFASASEAVEFFRESHVGDQSELCLARALFAAKTSRRFRDEGVVIIGVFLPARSLHAWVIEGGKLADPWDDIWINYQPVAILS